MINRTLLIFFCFMLSFSVQGQEMANPSSSEILLKLKKLKVLGSVLYIAAHPDDENTRLLAYLSKDKLLRTGYLSLTRGDGGQNLIGDEQGVSLGLIRTQELLAARRIDGAEQYFTTAYDFGFSKNPEETFKIWDKEKILGDMVWVIRKFRPDVIIARFPGDDRAGHGHHTASGLLAKEAFEAAADPNRYPDHFTKGVNTWQAKRVLWNTYNFGNNNTIRPGQFRVNVGAYKPLLGLSIGEIAAESRSQHKSQGFGVPSSRGESFEYFETLGGEPPLVELTDDINLGWERAGNKDMGAKIQKVIDQYNFSDPAASVKDLAEILTTLRKDIGNYVAGKPKELAQAMLYYDKISEVQALIRACLGLYFEAVTNQQFAVSGDSVSISFNVVNRSNIPVTSLSISYNDSTYKLGDSALFNRPLSMTVRMPVVKTPMDDQPYWLTDAMNEGSYSVENQNMIGLAENPSGEIRLFFVAAETNHSYYYPLRFKYTDPVKGEIYQPVITVPAIVVTLQPAVVLTNVIPKSKPSVTFRYQSLKSWDSKKGAIFFTNGTEIIATRPHQFDLVKDKNQSLTYSLDSILNGKQTSSLSAAITIKVDSSMPTFSNFMRLINYEHLPTIHYMFQSKVKVINEEIKTAGKRIGYIRGAGDNIPDALEVMGYDVVLLDEADLTSARLSSLDAIITGVRAYNVHNFLSDKYDVLMSYVQNGGNLIVQYNTNSMVGPFRARISPYPFSISRTRISNENAPVKFNIPSHRVLNFPNKITQKDFEGWIQERGIYFADQLDSNFQSPLSMNDPGEPEQNGSLVIADYGKGKFVYTGLVFFRQLPAGVPGAFRLLANIIGLNQKN